MTFPQCNPALCCTPTGRFYCCCTWLCLPLSLSPSHQHSQVAGLSLRHRLHSVKNAFHPSSAPPALKSQGHGCQAVALGFGELPESITAWASLGKTVQARPGLHGSPKEAELFQVSSLEPLWQRCFFLNYRNSHGNGSNCCPETLTPAFS